MIKMNVKNPFDPIIEELCSRYNLQPEQISFEISIENVKSKGLAREIITDFREYEYSLDPLVPASSGDGSYFGCTSGHFTDISVRTVSLSES